MLAVSHRPARRSPASGSVKARPVWLTHDPTSWPGGRRRVIADAPGSARYDVGVVLGSGRYRPFAALGSPTTVLPQVNCPGLCRQPQPGMRASYVRAHRCARGSAGLARSPSTPTRTRPALTSCIRFGRPVRQGRRLYGAHQRRRWAQGGPSGRQPVLIGDHLNLTARSPLVGGESST